MARNSILSAISKLVLIVFLCGGPSTVWSQQVTHSQFTANQGPPWDPAQTQMEQEPAAGWAVRAGRLFDPRSGKNLTNQVILIKNGIITDVEPAAQVQIPAGARVIDL